MSVQARPEEEKCTQKGQDRTLKGTISAYESYINNHTMLAHLLEMSRFVIKK